MSNLITPAYKIAADLLKDVNLKDEKEVRRVLREGYHNVYCNKVYYGHTSSGYKAWRKACRVLTGLQPRRKDPVKKKKEFNDPNQMELF